MKINELINSIEVFVSNEERELLQKLRQVTYIERLTEREKYVVEGLIKRSLVVKVGNKNPRVIANVL